MFCSMYETFYVVSKNTFAKIAHSVSIFVAFSLLCCICKFSFMLKILYVAWQKYMWHCHFQLLTFTIVLFLDMTLAWDPTFIKYPIIKHSWN